MQRIGNSGIPDRYTATKTKPSFTSEQIARRKLHNYKKREIWATDEQFLKLQLYFDKIRKEDEEKI